MTTRIKINTCSAERYYRREELLSKLSDYQRKLRQQELLAIFNQKRDHYDVIETPEAVFVKTKRRGKWCVVEYTPESWRRYQYANPRKSPSQRLAIKQAAERRLQAPPPEPEPVSPEDHAYNVAEAHLIIEEIMGLTF